jgi:hypothetical protein
MEFPVFSAISGINRALPSLKSMRLRIRTAFSGRKAEST